MNPQSSPQTSINMAVFNAAEYLSEAIESMLAQTLTDFELIIVDDGSTDNSWKILTDFAKKDSRIKLFKQANGGVAPARNFALQQSCGEYIVVMDADDISLPRRLELQKAFLDQHPAIDAVGSQWQMIKPNGKDAGIDTHATRPDDIEALMYVYYSLHHPTTMLRKTAMESVGGYSEEAGRLCVDYHLFMKMQLVGCKFCNLPDVLFKWRLNPSSITHSKAGRQTHYAYATRDEGFEQLLKTEPSKALALAQKITYTFPTGTWLDAKIKSLLPEYAESLLYKTWLSQPAPSAEKTLYRTIVLWLREPLTYHSALSTLLRQENLPAFSALVDAKFASNDPPTGSVLLATAQATPQPAFQLSIFIPFVDDTDDFFKRLELAAELQLRTDAPIEFIIFSADRQALDENLVANRLPQSSAIVVHRSPYSWQQAIESAHGNYFAYLEENFRFNIDAFIHLIQAVCIALPEQLYLFNEHYYSEALDSDSQPLRNEQPGIRWSRETLLGKNHLALSGFIHKRALLKEYPAIFHECGFVCSHILARQLAQQHDFDIHTGVLNYSIPPINLDSTPLAAFQKNIIDWFFDYGNGLLPHPSCWQNISQVELRRVALSLSTLWANDELLLHPGNRSTIKLFYLQHVKIPTRYPLFRYLLIHNKREILAALWHQGSYIQSVKAALYCGFNILYKRLGQ